jgi:ribosome-associated heat shock protein Hsp15
MSRPDHQSSGAGDAPVVKVRLDVWLDVACLFKTRSEAQRACRLGKVTIDGAVAKPHREVRVGDALQISRPLGRKQLLVVRGLAEAHVAKATARELYEDNTPPPSALEIEARRLERIFRATNAPAGRPDRRQRRDRRRMKEGEGV